MPSQSVIRLQVPDRDLQRGQLAQLVVRVDQDLDRQMLDPPPHLLGVVAEDDDHFADRRLLERGDDFFDESLAVDRQQRLGPSHAARFTGGENHCDDHYSRVESVGSLVNFIDEAALVQFSDDTVVDDILDAQSSAGLSRQRLFDLDLGSFPGYQWNAIMQLYVGGPG